MSLKDITIPFSSFCNAMIVTVDGTGKHPLGLKDVLYNFKYECQKNDSKYINRPACKYIFFYVSGGPKKIVYWSIVSYIIETAKKRIYFLESLMKLKKQIPLGKIPPNFKGGALEVSLDVLFKVNNMDELYDYKI